MCIAHHRTDPQKENAMPITAVVMKDASEIVHYNIPGLPVYLRQSLLSDYPDMRALCHWHDCLEFIRILDGEMNYYINGKNILLRRNDCIMINSRQMHYGYSHKRRECEFICLLFDPCLLSGNTALHEKYVTPVLENHDLEYLYLPADSEQSAETGAFSDIRSILDHMVRIVQKGAAAYEFELLSGLSLLWSRLLKAFDMIPEKKNHHSGNDLSVSKEMVSYIYKHYAEKIQLADIAAAGNVCRNKCCSIFRRYLQQTPIDFLNDYRLEVSCHLLKSTSANVSEIALACGFNHLSYYSRLFGQKYGCTPREYRKLPPSES